LKIKVTPDKTFNFKNRLKSAEYIIYNIFFLQTLISYIENRGGKGLKEKGKEKAENSLGA